MHQFLVISCYFVLYMYNLLDFVHFFFVENLLLLFAIVVAVFASRPRPAASPSVRLLKRSDIVS